MCTILSKPRQPRICWHRLYPSWCVATTIHQAKATNYGRQDFHCFTKAEHTEQPILSRDTLGLAEVQCFSSQESKFLFWTLYIHSLPFTYFASFEFLFFLSFCVECVSLFLWVAKGGRQNEAGHGKPVRWSKADSLCAWKGNCKWVTIWCTLYLNEAAMK